MEKPKKVTIVNHGNVFNTGSWYTFYCPECKNQVQRTPDKIKEDCKFCSASITWLDD